jgi:hypothetical protein
VLNPVRAWFAARQTRVIAAVLLAGLALREAFSFWTGHPYDLEVWVRTGYVVSHGSNPYLGEWPPVPGVSFGYTGEWLYGAAYLPFWPDIFGGTYVLWEHVGGGNRFALYFLLKQGPIAGDLLVAGLLYRYVLRETHDRRLAIAALSFWMFFPYDILISAIWGQLDSVTTAVVLAVLLASEAQAAERSILWGFGIFAKWVTVIFLPLEFFRNRGYRRLWPFVGLALVGVLTVVAFLAAGWGVDSISAGTASSTGGGSGGMNWVQLLNLPFLAAPLQSHPIYFEILTRLWIPACILAGWYAARWLRTPTAGATLRALLFVTTVLLLSRGGVNEQYMLYPFALLAADVYTLHPDRRRFFYVFVVVALGFLLTNDVLGVWFASPAFPQSYTFAQNIDDSSFWGTLRYDLLYVWAVLVTVTLVQLLVVLIRDEPNPRPWLVLGGPWRKGEPAGARPAGPGPAPGP